MPGLGGLELIKETKRVNHNIRTVLMTAFDIDDILFREYTKTGMVNGFLQKPIKLRELNLEVNKQIRVHEVCP
jgi:YesN/AraC family two-component response regulator